MSGSTCHVFTNRNSLWVCSRSWIYHMCLFYSWFEPNFLENLFQPRRGAPTKKMLNEKRKTHVRGWTRVQCLTIVNEYNVSSSTLRCCNKKHSIHYMKIYADSTSKTIENRRALQKPMLDLTNKVLFVSLG